jgi:hypothetical protein
MKLEVALPRRLDEAWVMQDVDQELASLKEMLLTMASHAESSVYKVIEALGKRDYDLAQRIEADDMAIDRFEVAVDDMAIKLLGQAPGASDLRLITVAMKISQNLERVGDETTSIARRVQELCQDAPLKMALDLGITLFAGELEGRLDGLLHDWMGNGLKPLYNYIAELPDMSGTPTPFLPPDRVRLTIGKRASFDAGRGCPYQCSFCTIINVQGHKSRFRDADDVERLVRANWAAGVSNFFITDDNLARNGNWEEIFDRLIALQAEGIVLQLVIQADTQSHRIPGFIEKASQAGVTRVFMGLESINPDALKTAHKGQNKITDYRAMLQAWQRARVVTYAGYILGFPNDTPATIRRDLAIIQRELPVDILEFFILTPLPGSADHQRLVEAGARLDPDMNKYDLQHVTMDHPLMTAEEWWGIYREAWDIFYSPAHVATVLRRCRLWGYDPKHMMGKLFAFHGPIVFEHIHPLEGGILRIKRRRDRRPELPIEHPLVFYPKLALEFVRKLATAYRMHRRYRRILAEVMAEPVGSYTDIAMTPVGEVADEQLGLFTATVAAREFVQKRRGRVATQVG